MTSARLLFIAQPPPAVRDRMVRVLIGQGIDKRLGASLFPLENWHQSLSNRYAFTKEKLETLKLVGDCVRASQFSMTMNRLSSSGDEESGFQWAFRAKGQPEGLRTLIQCIQSEMLNRGIDDRPGHTGHVTISYRAPSAISSIRIEPLVWKIEELLLVCGHGEPYRYEILERWLLPSPLQSDPIQETLFDSSSINLNTAVQNSGAVINRELILQTLRSRVVPDLLAAYAFGSQVRGTARPDSDLDLAVLTAGNAEPLQLWDIAQSLEDEVKCAVDLLDLRAASTVMQYQVITTGQRWWAKNERAALYESAILSEKTRLDESRAGLLSDIRARGSIYG